MEFREKWNREWNLQEIKFAKKTKVAVRDMQYTNYY